jgi:hypothetical protein
MRFKNIPLYFRTKWVKEYNSDFGGTEKVHVNSLTQDVECAMAKAYIDHLHTLVEASE